MTNDTPRDAPPFTPEQFASLGGGAVAYVRSFDSAALRRAFPQAPEAPAGVTIFALLAADGSPIVLTDSKDAAIANAWENELQTVSVH